MNKAAPLAVLLALALAAPTAAAQPLVNQLENPGFEEAADGADAPAQWRVEVGEVSLTSDATEGDQAVQLKAVGDTPVTTLAQEVALEDEDAPIVPNAEYELSFAALLNTGADTPVSGPPSAYGQVVWKDAVGETTDVDRIDVADTDTYEDYADTFRAPEDAVAADVQFHLERENVEDRTDANLKVDATAFGPVLDV
jgi:hypothetical protein